MQAQALGVLPGTPGSVALAHIVVSYGDMETNRGEAGQLYGDFNIGSASDLKELATKIRADKDLLMRTWPYLEKQCYTVAAEVQIRNQFISLIDRCYEIKEDLRRKGVRKLITEEYDNAYHRLAADFTGKFGWGPINGSNNPVILDRMRKAGMYIPENLEQYYVGAISADTARNIGLDAVEHCINEPTSVGGGVRERTFFILGRIASFLETIAFLEDIKPWFSVVFDVIFDLLFVLGQVATVVAKAVGAVLGVIPKTLDAMAAIADKTAAMFGMMGKVLKWSVYAFGAYVLWKYVLKRPKKKTAKGTA